MGKFLKTVVSMLVCIAMTLSAASLCFAEEYTIEDAYAECCEMYPEFIDAVKNTGITVTDDQILALLKDVQNYLNSGRFEVTKENFDDCFKEAVMDAFTYRQNISVRDALIKAFPDAAIEAQQGKLPEKFRPLYETMKSIIFSHDMVDMPSDDKTEPSSENETESSSENATEPSEKPSEESTEPETEKPTNKPTQGDHGIGGPGVSTDKTENDKPTEKETESVPTEPVTSPKVTFNDMQDAKWAEEAVYKLAEMGIISGYGDGSFKPGNKITRAEFSKIIVMVTGMYDKNAQCEFTDVKKGDWFYSYVASAEKLGLINGRGNGIFDPNAQITRADICVIVYRYIKMISPEFGKAAALNFSDSEAIPSYAKEAVGVLLNAGIVSGMDGNRFEPLQPATRAQSAKIVYGAIKAVMD